MSAEIQLHYEFHNIRFAAAQGRKDGVALANGWLSAAGTGGRFGLTLSPMTDGQWELVEKKCDDGASMLLHRADVLQQLVNKAATLLTTINVWPAEGDESSFGTRLSLNQQMVPSAFADRVFISFRPDMLFLPMNEWADVWGLIESRIIGDPHFRVHGFTLDEVKQAIISLKQIFPAAWVAARYKQKYTKPKMADDLRQDAEGWFPAYHLARTALGAICIDPAWNYLVEIGLSIRELENFTGLKRLTQQISRSPGTQHHLCLAAELFRRGHLLALEPRTGSGQATNDLLVACGERQYEIEVKEFASSDPTRQLTKEIAKKCRNLPEHPERPIVFHTVLMERGIFEKAKEDLFFNALKEQARNIPRKISAIVAGRRFVDSAGGRVKRDAEIQILNPAALLPSNADDLATLFTKNYSSVRYPLSGIGSFFGFSLGK